MTTEYIDSGASISKCGNYRYLLWREWRGSADPTKWRWLDKNEGYGEPKPVLFVMLNPSTADGNEDDATIRRCVGFAKSWGYDRVEVVNLYAFRATNPKDLLDRQGRGEEVIGWENSEAVTEAALRSDLIVCAWGTNVKQLDPTGYHVETVRGWLEGRPEFALALTKEGYPKHPLYIPSNAELIKITEGCK